MPDLIDTTEMYLRTLYELLEEGFVPMRARIVERLNQAGPTVSQTVARMERDGLLVVGDDRTIALTEEGLTRAASVMRRHRLAECMLSSTLGVDLDVAHEEACRWEHVMTDFIEGRVAAFLGAPTISPYGMPIPERLEGPIPDLAQFRDQRQSARAAADAAGGEVRGVITGVSELAQATDWLMEDLFEAGLVPGVEVWVRKQEPGYVFNPVGGGEVTLIADYAEAIYLGDR